MADNDWSPDNPNVLFDLRQTYAMRILTPILLEIREHRVRSDYIKWFETLTDDLYTEINQKLSSEEREEYKKELEATLEILNTFKEVFKGTDKTPEKRYKLKKALLNLEMWIKNKMEEKGLYGKGSSYDMDEI